MDLFTPRSVVAGCFPSTKANAQREAIRVAGALLGADRVGVVVSHAADLAWFIAAPASDMSSHLGAGTALSAALPGADGHQGDGAYTLDLGQDLQAVVVKHDKRLQSFVGSPAMVERFIRLEAAPVVHACPAKGLPWTLPADGVPHKADRWLLAISAVGWVVTVIAAGVWLMAAVQTEERAHAAEAQIQGQAASVTAALKAVEPNAYPKALDQLQTAIEQAAKEGGNLVQFESHGGRATWTLNVNGQPKTGSSP